MKNNVFKKDHSRYFTNKPTEFIMGCIRWLPPELVDNGDLPEISILQTSILGLLLQLSNRPNEYTLSYLVFFKLKKKPLFKSEVG